jgi:hypothetical protein
MKPSAEQLHTLRTIARQYPDFIQYLTDWRRKEMEQLPYARENLGVLQGRAQLLTEMQRNLTGTVE